MGEVKENCTSPENGKYLEHGADERKAVQIPLREPVRGKNDHHDVGEKEQQSE